MVCTGGFGLLVIKGLVAGVVYDVLACFVFGCVIGAVVGLVVVGVVFNLVIIAAKGYQFSTNTENFEKFHP